MRQLASNLGNFFSQKRATAISEGNLVLAEFIASQMPGQEVLTAEEMTALRQALIKKNAKLSNQLWTSYFLVNKELAWTSLKKELQTYLQQGQFSEVIEVLQMLRSLTEIEEREHSYRRLVEAVPKIYFQQDKLNVAFEEFIRQEIRRLIPDHQKLVRYYAKIFFYFARLGEIPRRWLYFCNKEMSRYQIGSAERLACELINLVEELKSLES